MAQSKSGYIPAGIQRAMDQHMERMPANLQKYQGGNTYIPSSAAKSMSSYMSKSMPAHMQQYIEPYMKKQVKAGMNSLDPVTPRAVQERAPVPNLMRRDHSTFGQQFTVNVNTSGAAKRNSLSFSPQYSGDRNSSAAVPPAPPPAPLPNAPGQGGNQNPYDFIMNSNNKPRGMFSGGGSTMSRIIIVVVGAVSLIILAIVLFSVLSGSSGGSVANLTDVAQRQTEIARISAVAVEKSNSTAIKNRAHTVKLSMLSSQQQTIALLTKSGEKVDAKVLALKQNAQTDQQLDAATANDTFDATFTKILDEELKSYRIAVQNYFNSSTSNNEKLLLKESFDGVNLLIGEQKSS